MEMKDDAGDFLMFPTFLRAPIPWKEFRQGDLAYCVIADTERGDLSVIPSPRMGPAEVEALRLSVSQAQAHVQQSPKTLWEFDRCAVHLPTVYGTERPERFTTVGEAAVRARTLLEFRIKLRAYRTSEDAPHKDHDLAFDRRHPPDTEVYRHPVEVRSRLNWVTMYGGDVIPDLRHEGFYCVTCGCDVPLMELGLTPEFEINVIVS